MNSFEQMRKRGQLYRPTTIVELGFWDLLRMLLGREIEALAHSEYVVVRSRAAYEAFNLSAPRAPDVEAAGSAPKPRDRA